MEDLAARGGDPQRRRPDLSRSTRCPPDCTDWPGFTPSTSGSRPAPIRHSSWVQTWAPTEGFQVGLRRRLPTGLERAGGLLPDAVRGLNGDGIVDQWARFVSTLGDGGMTLLHGDAHIGNTYVLPGGDVGFLDWQVTRRGNWSQDVGYFLMGAMTEEDRRAHEFTLVDDYFGALDASRWGPIRRARGTVALPSVGGVRPGHLALDARVRRVPVEGGLPDPGAPVRDCLRRTRRNAGPGRARRLALPPRAGPDDSGLRLPGGATTNRRARRLRLFSTSGSDQAGRERVPTLPRGSGRPGLRNARCLDGPARPAPTPSKREMAFVPARRPAPVRRRGRRRARLRPSPRPCAPQSTSPTRDMRRQRVGSVIRWLPSRRGGGDGSSTRVR